MVRRSRPGSWGGVRCFPAEKLAPDGNAQGPLVEFGAHVRLHLAAVKLGQAAPVPGGLEMMRGVEAVIEKQPIEERPGDIPRMVVGGMVVAALMLEEIDG